VSGLSRREFAGRLVASCAGCALAEAGLATGPEAAPLLQDAATPSSRARGRDAGLNPVRARWQKPLGDGLAQCGVCARACAIARGERGHCLTRENREGTIHTLTYARACAVGLDPVEKKPFFHVLPGAMAFSIATPGCNLHCRCCQNWEIAQAAPEEVPTSPLPPAEVAALARDRGAPLVACTYTEPTIAAEYVTDVAAAGRRAGVRTLVVSNGYLQEAPLAALCREIAAYKVDLKGFDAAYYRMHTGGELSHVQDTLRRLKKNGVWTEIVTLVIPTQNDSETETRALARFVRDELSPEVPLHFTRFHPAWRLQNLPSTPVATLERCRRVAMDEGLRFVYLGNVPGHPGENTYCPGCGRVLVRRVGMATVENRLAGDACPGCRRKVPGIWS
jgi:pyruvate formate lyase activating enzyme